MEIIDGMELHLENKIQATLQTGIEINNKLGRFLVVGSVIVLMLLATRRRKEE